MEGWVVGGSANLNKALRIERRDDLNVIGRAADRMSRLVMRAAMFLVLFPLAALAQDGIRAGDVVPSPRELTDLLEGQVVEFYDGSKSRYGRKGQYSYTYTDDGPEWTGTFTVQEDSQLCVDFDNGSARCDRFVRNGERVILIIDDGTRFPVRNLSVYKD